jgi:tetratricopeptide (TPR) repeat protein
MLYMSGSPFVPRVYQGGEQVVTAPKPVGPDKIGTMILKVEQYLIASLLFLIPVFFVPGLPASLGFDKVLIATIIALSTLVLLGLSSLRYTKVNTVLPLALGAFWIIVLVAVISGSLSGDIMDTLRGSVFEPQTAGFLAVMGLLMTAPLVLQRSKKMSLNTLIFFGAGAGLVLLYNLVRILFGAELLQLRSFGTQTVSPVGGFNDLAIFSALSIIIALITLLQLPLKKLHQIIIAVFTVVALAVMMVVNFFNLWLLVGFFALLLLVYIFSRDMLFSLEGESKTPISPVLILVTILVCVVSIMFVVAGDYVGTKINTATGIEYLEVRPSVTATIDITKGVYSEDVLLGTGPNKFVDAWRLYKDPAINETIFWNTNFNAGFGYTPTLFATLGILGALAVLAFQGLYLHLGYRMLLKSTNPDSFWYYFGVTTFASAVFLWIMSYLYVSGPVILLLTALFTGLSFVAYQALVPQAGRTFALVSSRRRGFFLMTLVIVLIVGSVSAVFTMGKQYVAQAQFTEARTTATDAAQFQQMAGSAFSQYPDDIFLGTLAQSRLVVLRQMLALENPTEEDQAKFVNEARQAVAEAEEAIRLDPSNPGGHATLADILIVLAAVGFEDAENRANGKLADAKWRDPLNPLYPMAAASLAIQLQDNELARKEIATALTLKRNYSEALFLLSQIDVQEGKIEDAINTARQITTLEPNNPTRYYQLGVLLAANKDSAGAIAAYEAAIVRDSNFANARYMLALTYLDASRLEDALTQLRIVRESNQDNEQLNSLITQLETNGYIPTPVTGLEGSVNEAAPGQEGDSVVSPGDPNTNLVSPVNNVNGQQPAEQQATNQPAQ